MCELAHSPVKGLIKGHFFGLLLIWLATFCPSQNSHAMQSTQTLNQESYLYHQEAQATVSPLVGLMPKKDMRLYAAVMDHARLSSLDDLLIMKGVPENAKARQLLSQAMMQKRREIQRIQFGRMSTRVPPQTNARSIKTQGFGRTKKGYRLYAESKNGDFFGAMALTHKFRMFARNRWRYAAITGAGFLILMAVIKKLSNPRPTHNPTHACEQGICPHHATFSVSKRQAAPDVLFPEHPRPPAW